MLRTAAIAIILLAASALGAVLLCALTLRVLLSAAFALSGNARRMTRSTQVLDW
jgi:hypothetical protein